MRNSAKELRNENDLVDETKCDHKNKVIIGEGSSTISYSCPTCGKFWTQKKLVNRFRILKFKI